MGWRKGRRRRTKGNGRGRLGIIGALCSVCGVVGWVLCVRVLSVGGGGGGLGLDRDTWVGHERWRRKVEEDWGGYCKPEAGKQAVAPASHLGQPQHLV